MQHMFAVCAFFYLELDCCESVLEIATDCGRHNGLNQPFRVHLTFSQTQLVEMVT